MKKFHILTIIMLLALSINSNAQLNYLFSATTRPYVPVTDGITPHLITDYAPWEVEMKAWQEYRLALHLTTIIKVIQRQMFP